MRRADALEMLADDYLARAGDGAESSSTGGDRYTVHIHTRADDLQAAAETERVSAETSRRAACDCGVVHWLENERGHALDIGRRTRNITPALRRASEHRDGGCAFPGCTTRRHVDAHHVHHWADGGETKLDNLVLLCRHHHRLVHEGGYSVALLAGGEKRFHDPGGALLSPGPDRRFTGNVLRLLKQQRRKQPHINPRTLLSRWRGERMDLSMAIDGLRRRESEEGDRDDSG